MFTACGEDFFSTTLKVDPPPHEDQLVLQSFLKSNDSLLYFSLSKSVGILETQNSTISFISDAVIEVYEDGELKYEPTLSSSTPFNFGVVLDEPLNGIGKTYEVRVTHDSLGTISGSQQMPAAPNLVSATFDEDGGIDIDFGDEAHAIDLVMLDPPNVKNYYEVILARYSTISGELGNDYYIYSNDFSASEGVHEYLLVDDASFDGQEYTFRFETSKDWQDDLYVVVRSVTEDWYLYSKSLERFQVTQDFQLFSEPVTVHTNIENGLGVFGMATQGLVKVDLE